MAQGVTRIADVVVPEIFSPYVQQLTQEKSNLIRSGAISVDARLGDVLGQGGLTFNEPSFKDLENDAENISTDNPADISTPNKIQTSTEIQVRLSRNSSWSSMDLTGDLAGSDPLMAIASRVSDYWVRRHQKAFVATMNGVFAENKAGTNDMTFDVSGAAYADGVTNFSAEAFIDATATMGDSMDNLTMVMMHSLVYARALKNNLIDFIPQSINEPATRIPTFLGRQVIVDDGMPNAAGVFDTWLFGSGAIRAGMGSPKTPTEYFRTPNAGMGSGLDTLYNRVEWILHPVGYQYAGTAPNGGPSNDSTTNNLAAATSWKRVYPERKQVRIGRLITREF